MAVKEIITTSPLLGRDIVDTLSYYGGIGVSDNVLSCFSLTAGINAWARNKPMRSNASIAMTSAEKESNGRSDGFGGYGISIYYAFRKSPIDFYKDEILKYKRTVGYAYRRPQGGQASPYRPADFIGYNAVASIPVTNTFRDEQFIPTATTSIPLDGGINTTPPPSEYQISESDLYPQIDNGDGTTSKPNRGILVIYKDSSNNDAYLWATSTLPTGTGISAPIGSWANILQGKTVTIMEFFTNYPANRNSESNSISDPNPEWENSVHNFWIAAIPDPLRVITFEKIESGGGGGTTPTTPIAYAEITSWPTFISDDNKSVSVTFIISAQNGYSGGNITGIRYGIYTNSRCTTAVTEKTIASFNLQKNSKKTFSDRALASDGEEIRYFGVFFNGSLQASKAVALAKYDDIA